MALFYLFLVFFLAFNHFPMQNRLKMFFKVISGDICPVISPRSDRHSRRSSANKSEGRPAVIPSRKRERLEWARTKALVMPCIGNDNCRVINLGQMCSLINALHQLVQISAILCRYGQFSATKWGRVEVAFIVNDNGSADAPSTTLPSSSMRCKCFFRSASSSTVGFSSMTQTTTAARAMASYDRSIPIRSILSSVCLIPAVSMIRNLTPLMVIKSSTRSLVVPSISLTIALSSCSN